MIDAVDLVLPSCAVLAQAAHDVLDVDDGVVDDHPEGDDEPGQDHRVDGGAPPVEHQPGGHQRQRDGDEADQRRSASRRGRATRIRTTSRQPRSSARLRLSSAISMKVAGRKMVVSISMPGRPGRISSMRRLDALGHLERVAPGELLDDQHQARAVVDDGVADQRLVVLDHVGHVAEAQRLAVRARSTTTSARSSGVTIGRTCRTPSRWLGVSMNPPVPITAPSE